MITLSFSGDYKMDEKISVIIPVYNLENVIGKCIESVLNQTYGNIEIIVIDDGSCDNSLKIIARYERENSNIKVIKQKNRGVTAARLAGVEVATGDCIGFVDGDDYIDADMYELLMNNMRQYHTDISHCGFQMEFRDGRIRAFYNTGEIIVQDNTQGLIDLISGVRVEPGLWNKLYKKKLFENFRQDESIRINEDLLMNYYLFKKAQSSVFCDVCKYHYIIRENSASRQKLNRNKIIDPIRVKKIMLEDSNVALVKTVIQRMYMETLLNIYNQIILNDTRKEYQDYKSSILKLLKKEECFVGFLPLKKKVLYFGAVYGQAFYKLIYKLYERYFQEKKYD